MLRKFLSSTLFLLAFVVASPNEMYACNSGFFAPEPENVKVLVARKDTSEQVDHLKAMHVGGGYALSLLVSAALQAAKESGCSSKNSAIDQQSQ